MDSDVEARAAAEALSRVHAWECLRDKSTLAALRHALPSGASAQHLSSMLSRGEGVDRLEEISRRLLGEEAATSAAATPPSDDDKRLIVQLLTELSSCRAFPENSPLRRLSTDALPCVICGLVTIGASGLVATGPLPYDGHSMPEGAGEERFGRLLIRSMVPPKDTPGWVLTRIPACGHWVHDHCALKLYAQGAPSSGGRPHCPACDKADPYTTLEWRYGRSGTRFEMNICTEPEVVDGKDHMEKYDPRDWAVVVRQLPLTLLDELEEMQHGGPLSAEQEESEMEEESGMSASSALASASASASEDEYETRPAGGIEVEAAQRGMAGLILQPEGGSSGAGSSTEAVKPGSAPLADPTLQAAMLPRGRWGYRSRDEVLFNLMWKTGRVRIPPGAEVEEYVTTDSDSDEE